jgi:acyl-CoA reductase-like NAD-dependent aldehyde dehydrogenase
MALGSAKRRAWNLASSLPGGPHNGLPTAQLSIAESRLHDRRREIGPLACVSAWVMPLHQPVWADATLKLACGWGIEFS